jgi:hypothetical protein
VPARVERVLVAPVSGMPADADGDWVHQSKPADVSIGHPFAGVCCEHVSAADGMPVSLVDGNKMSCKSMKQDENDQNLKKGGLYI